MVSAFAAGAVNATAPGVMSASVASFASHGRRDMGFLPLAFETRHPVVSP